MLPQLSNFKNANKQHMTFSFWESYITNLWKRDKSFKKYSDTFFRKITAANCSKMLSIFLPVSVI